MRVYKYVLFLIKVLITDNNWLDVSLHSLLTESSFSLCVHYSL